MIQNYFKIAGRNLFSKKSHFLINIVGLSVSLTATLLMLLWVRDEWNMDKFHENGDRIYRVKRTIPLEDNRLDVYETASYPMLEAAVKELPEVEKYMTLGSSFEESLQLGDKQFRVNGTFTNTAFFEAFSYPVLIGDVGELDKKTDAIVISESFAKKLFGNVWQSTALGQIIHIHDNGDFAVAAVYKDFPKSSSIQNDFYYSFIGYLKANDWMLDWGNNGMQGALLLAENADPKAVGEKLEKIFQSHQAGTLKEGCFLQKYADHYLYGQFNDKAQVAGGRIEYVRIFGIAALLLLLISCINFVNLATAHASKRAKEVGVRKAVGAGKRSLIWQFMVEAGLITSISVLLAMLLAMALLPQVNILTGKTLAFDFKQPVIWTGVLSVFLTTTLLAGAYPAFVLSSFRPISALKGEKNEQGGTISFRKSLVVMQFCLSLSLIVGALVVRQQVQFIQRKNLGLNKDNLLAIHHDENINAHYDVLRQELLSADGIKDVTLAGPFPLTMPASTSGVQWPGKRPDQENIEFSILWTSSNFADVFGVPMAAGAYYHPDREKDTTSIVLNEKAIEVMGMSDPIGKTIQWWRKPRQIVGVVKDFHNRSLYEKIEPAGFLLDAERAGQMFVKAEQGKVSEAITSIGAAFKKVVPAVPLHYEFVDDEYQRLYENEVLTEALANYFALISILISCLGLFGLITFSAEQRAKEIGIRKVLGASIAAITGLLTKDFLKLVLIAIFIATPVAYFLMKNWLEKFAYRIDIQWWIFAIAGAAAVMIAFATVSFQSIKAALANPVKSLRSE